MAEERVGSRAAREAILRLRPTVGEVAVCLMDAGFTVALGLPQRPSARLDLSVVGHVVFEQVSSGRWFVAGVVRRQGANVWGRWGKSG